MLAPDVPADEASDVSGGADGAGRVGLRDAAAGHVSDQTAHSEVEGGVGAGHCAGRVGLCDGAVAVVPDQAAHIQRPAHSSGRIGLRDGPSVVEADEPTDVVAARALHLAGRVRLRHCAAVIPDEPAHGAIAAHRAGRVGVGHRAAVVAD